jgi:TfoX/Sxy family transcriptional regulator of competence genes
MARSPSDPSVERAPELFSALDRPVPARRTFGGLGLHAGGLFSASGDHEEGRPGLKVGDESRAALEAAGGQRFTHTTPRRPRPPR